MKVKKNTNLPAFMKKTMNYSYPIDGNYKVEINLDDIYQAKSEKEAFERRWRSFISSCSPFDDIFKRDGNVLRYSSETFIPSLIDKRPPLLLVFGNPATHSVSAGFCFSYERGESEHRIWRAFRRSGLLDFAEMNHNKSSPSQRKNDFLNLRYISPFRIGITTFFSFPSPASDKHWSGVSGVKKLFGKKALTKIIQEEKMRLHEITRGFMGLKGTVICFQKDAYENLKGPFSSMYTRTEAMSGNISGKYFADPEIIIYCLPPTRYALSNKFVDSLKRTLDSINSISHL